MFKNEKIQCLERVTINQRKRIEDLEDKVCEFKTNIKVITKILNAFRENEYNKQNWLKKHTYTIEIPEINETVNFETEEEFIKFFSNEIWEKKAFKLNKKAWECLKKAWNM